ncbi:DNA-binding transcriptional regulator, LysR family [Rhodococcus triatomae]|uniref:DNA-binding transcriptional regulator, LysR family n=1 Tax=Rhodococcus triatomae TaxID=300028 RepID=A0A1G8GEV6_9NOCA|nr:LysR substrate-binding domain-containing protein [Rhodococcus triatomae]SDH92932.1 DNA-binding transcriptional regulator, LysR family [Rhodococcus triatomae]
MDIRDAEYLVAVVDHGGVTRASKALFIAQPSLSQAIRALERDLGVELFTRGGRELQPTEAGLAFTAAARRVLADVDRGRAAVRDVVDLTGGVLTLSVLNSLAADPLPALAGRFHRRFPEVRLRSLSADTPDTVLRALRTGEADAGLSETGEFTHGLDVARLPDQELVLALHRDLAEELPDPVPVSALADIPMIVEIGETVQPPLENVAVECAHRQAVWELVSQGAGATLVPAAVAARELRDVEARRLDPPMVRDVGVLSRSGRKPPALAGLLALL